jgi:HEPN domain-containing protein
MTGAVRTRPAKREHAQRYLSKAQEFLRNAQRAADDADDSAVGLLAIHAGISACDAITAQLLGVRSAGQSHHEVLNLLSKATFPRKDALIKQLRRLLDEKNVVEYDDSTVSSGDAEEMLEAAKRIVVAAKELVD